MTQLIWYGIAYTATAGAGLVTLLALYLLVPALRHRWFPVPRLRPGLWTGREVFLAAFAWFAIGRFLVDLLLEMGFFTTLIGPPPDAGGPALANTIYMLRCVAISSPMSLTVSLGVLFAVMFIRSGSRPHHYGLTWARWPANLGLGVAGFLLTWPAIMGIHALAVFVFPPAADQFIALGKQGLPAWEWLLFAVQTTVAAPLLEEMLFRGILQGWLRRASLSGHVRLPFMTLFLTSYGFAEYDGKTEEYTYHFGPLVFGVLLAAGYGYWLYRLARRFELTEAEIQRWQPLPSEPSLEVAVSQEIDLAERRARDDARLQSWQDANATLAIFGTAMLFAVVHSNWPAPLPLFAMGLALGWLSRRTQSLIGPIVFHALFNLTTFIALYGTVNFSF